jgi:hypothetical protein
MFLNVFFVLGIGKAKGHTYLKDPYIKTGQHYPRAGLLTQGWEILPSSV